MKQCPFLEKICIQKNCMLWLVTSGRVGGCAIVIAAIKNWKKLLK